MTDAARAAETLHQLRGWTDPEAFHHRMRNDPRWAAAVRYACEHGIPISVFFGRVVHDGEPTWTAHDRAVAMGFEQWAAQICPSCGLHRLDWPTEDAETWKGRIDTCFGCVELADTRATIPGNVSDARRAAMRIYLVPRPGPERLLLEAAEAGEVDLDDLGGFT